MSSNASAEAYNVSDLRLGFPDQEVTGQRRVGVEGGIADDHMHVKYANAPYDALKFGISPSYCRNYISYPKIPEYLKSLNPGETVVGDRLIRC